MVSNFLRLCVMKTGLRLNFYIEAWKIDEKSGYQTLCLPPMIRGDMRRPKHMVHKTSSEDRYSFLRKEIPKGDLNPTRIRTRWF